MKTGRLKKKNIFMLNVVLLLLMFCSLSLAVAAAPDDDLMKKAKEVLGPLPASMPSEQNPITPEKVKLGKILFYESRISIDGTVSCAKCHPVSLYAVDGLRKAIGNNCKENPRNSPTIFNAASQISAHWIGNRTSVEDQARQSVTGPPAFGMPSNESAEKILRNMKEYVSLFKAAFPGEKDPVTIDNFAKAVGAFERTLMTPAPFDAFVKGDAKALTEKQKRGLKTFFETGCMACHFSPYVGGQMYQKFGVFETYGNYTKSATIDEGRYAVTKNQADKYVFKVPVLRNVAMTPPYFHDGSVDRLEEAVRIMGKIQLLKDLSKEEVADITVFFDSLTGQIPDDVMRVPLLPSRE
ncbi:MAG TPA: cytochrome c peroxidase [Nitrospirota bacterium]|nr:cytochrome c peroxidase [Nitrospirota bacterium]